MIKFRYKRKETTNNGGTNANNTSNSSTKNNSTKSVEIKSNETNKDDNNKPKLNSLKCETNEPALKTMTKIDPTQAIKVKPNTDQQYMEDCIRAIVVSLFKKKNKANFSGFFFFIFFLKLPLICKNVRIKFSYQSSFSQSLKKSCVYFKTENANGFVLIFFFEFLSFL